MPKKATARDQASPLKRYRVPILDRTLDLLELLSAQPDGLTLTAMAEKLSMPKNAVFRIATTLTLRGYALRDEGSKAYRVSPKLLNLGHQAIGGESLVQAAGPILTALRDATGETALLGTLSGANGIVLDQVASSHPVKVVVEIGHAFPLHTAAPAKAMLAHASDDTRTALISQIKFHKFTRHTLTSARAYRAALDQARTDGYALDVGEESETCACAAAPVFGHRGQVVAALWISGPSDRVSPQALPKLARIVKQHAAQLSGKLGAPNQKH